MIRTRRLGQLVVMFLVIVAGGVVRISAAQADPTSAQSELTALIGQGEGKVIISPTSAGGGTFDAHVKVNVHNTMPNTHFIVTAGGGDATIDGD
jgi:hypothetical protein